jgi:pyruvate formate lyase activating enzyme
LVVYGENFAVEEIIERALKEELFYQRGGGGLTISGGEPLSQPEFLLALVAWAKKKRLKVTLETCGYGSYEVLREVSVYLDLVLYDLKIIDPEAHRQVIGRDNALILENFARLVAERPDLPIKARIPVIPGFNDNCQAAKELGRFLAKTPGVDFEALPYHAYGRGKYAYLGRDYPFGQGQLDPSALSTFVAQTTAARIEG